MPLPLSKFPNGDFGLSIILRIKLQTCQQNELDSSPHPVRLAHRSASMGSSAFLFLVGLASGRYLMGVPEHGVNKGLVFPSLLFGGSLQFGCLPPRSETDSFPCPFPIPNSGILH